MRYQQGKQIPESLLDLEKMDCDWLTPAQVAPLLDTTPETLIAQVREDPTTLGFAVTILRSRIKFPRLALIHYMKYGAYMLEQ